MACDTTNKDIYIDLSAKSIDPSLQSPSSSSAPYSQPSTTAQPSTTVQPGTTAQPVQRYLLDHQKTAFFNADFPAKLHPNRALRRPAIPAHAPSHPRYPDPTSSNLPSTAGSVRSPPDTESYYDTSPATPPDTSLVISPYFPPSIAPYELLSHQPPLHFTNMGPSQASAFVNPIDIQPSQSLDTLFESEINIDFGLGSHDTFGAYDEYDAFNLDPPERQHVPSGSPESSQLKKRPRIVASSTLMATTGRSVPNRSTQFPCPYCKQGPFKDQVSLDTHVKKQHTRPYHCVFHFAGCTSTFATKNEWKRHVASQHLLLHYWLCQEGSCNKLTNHSGASSSNPESRAWSRSGRAVSSTVAAMAGPSIGPPLPNGTIFHRKDLYTQHLRRMHTPPNIKKPAKQQQQQQPRKASSPYTTPDWDAHLRTLASRAMQDRCALPTYMRCPAPGCEFEFHGPDAWDQRMEHVGRHLERVAASEEPPVEFGGPHDPTLIEWASRYEVSIIRRSAVGQWELNNPLRPTAKMTSTGEMIISMSNTAPAAPSVVVKQEDEIVVDQEADGDDYRYGSAPQKNLPAVNPKSGFDTTNQTDPPANLDDDAVTRVSGGTLLVSDAAQQAIADVCKDIIDRLSPLSDKRHRKFLQEDITFFVKAFALRLGLDSSVPLASEIMHFVYQYSNELVYQLLLRLDLDYESEEPNASTNRMSVLEKMAIWVGAKERESRDSPLAICIRVKDESNQEATDTKFSTYIKSIMQSKSYTWFIRGLQKQTQLYWSDIHPRIMVDQIRTRILETLPTGTTSSRRLPPVHMTFTIPGWEAEYKMGKESSKPIGEMIGSYEALVFSSPDQAQMITVRDYMCQTWPSCDILDATIDKSDEDLQILATQGIILSRGSNNLEVTVYGPSHYISQVGEQLAWLASALKPPSWGQDEFDAWIPSLSFESNETVTIYCNRATATPEYAIHTKAWGWASRRAAACGFPTLRRPEGYPGLEVSGRAMRRYLADDFSSLLCNLHDSSIVKDRLTSFAPVNFSDGVFLWHEITSKDELCGCQRYLLSDIDNDRLEMCRHVIGKCMPVTANHQGQLCVTSTGGDASQIDSASPCSQPSHISVQSTLLDSHSCDGSYDSELFSISESSQTLQLTPLEKTDALFRIVDETARRLLSQSRGADIYPLDTHVLHAVAAQEATVHGSISSRPYQPDSRNSGPPGAQIPASGGLPTSGDQDQGSHVPTGKRSRDESNVHSSESSCPDPSPQAKRSKNKDHDRKYLACPFWKRHPDRYRCCLPRRLSKISYVKQHLVRDHTPNFYCENCFVIFTTREDLVRHIRGSCGTDDPVVPLDGVTQLQSRMLHRKSKQGSTEPEQWYAIWGILFEDVSPPSSPYVDLDLSEDLRSFQEVLDSCGPAALREQLEHHGISLPATESQDSLLRRVWARAIELVEEQWRASRSLRPANLASTAATSITASGGRLPPSHSAERSIASVNDSSVVLLSTNNDWTGICNTPHLEAQTLRASERDSGNGLGIGSAAVASLSQSSPRQLHTITELALLEGYDWFLDEPAQGEPGSPPGWQQATGPGLGEYNHSSLVENPRVVAGVMHKNAGLMGVKAVSSEEDCEGECEDLDSEIVCEDLYSEMECELDSEGECEDDFM